ncbi:shootin-1 [Melanaphis sacchari]|uniref:shootin-1 n=1 Tax=Melanaphis sacchari TaxID=742174 RepID=UPI000DC13A39|nr:shootin-1 [Melanaphis sacchari]XP_025197751.1 shootin-1 [Melanaphis sacchari]
MSVQNLRNKFSQNNGSVPYNPPGLSYGKSDSTQNNNNNKHHHHQILNYQMQNGGSGRFKTIREEPDAPEDCSNKPVATKNNSFLQSYLASEMTRNSGSTGNGSKPIAAVQVPVHNRFIACKSSPTAEVASKLAVKSSQESCTTKLSFGEVKSSLKSPTAPVHPPKPIGAKPILPPLLPDSTPPRLSVKSSPVLNSNISPVPTSEDRWKNKYDETETKRKSLLIQSQKLLREKSDMERQVAKLRTNLELSNKDLSEKTLQLSQLRNLSEAMYKEYDQLKQQYELETTTLQKAMERASQWYKQNRELKRRSSALMQKVMSVAPSSLDDLADDTDGNENDTDNNDIEIEELRKTVKELTQEVSRLQAELNKIKLQEFEAQEQTVDLTSELEEERRARNRAEQELKELKMKHNNLESVSRKVVEETTVLHQQYKREKEEGVKIRSDANKVKSERDVLARQSQLLMMDAASDEKIMKLLFEIEQLQRTLNQERQEHIEQLKDLHEKLESQSESEQIELYEEKLKLIEAELLCSQQRVDIAESRVEDLEKQLRETKTVVATSQCKPPLPPPAPPAPPPPPPPPLMALPGTTSGIKLKTVSSLNHNSNAIEDLGNYLGLPLATPKGPQVQNGAIDAIINQIKGGRFSLKATDKEKQTLVKKQEPQPVVNEMMNVLGTLRRNPKRRASFKTAPADVAL